MAERYLTLITALLAAALGGGIALLTSYLTNRANLSRLKMELDHQSHQRKSELLRERGEELYELVDKWLKGLFGFYLNRSFVMQGKISLDQSLDLEIQARKERTDNFGRIEMLIDVYFPTVRAQYDAVIAGRSELNNVGTAHRRAYDQGEIDAPRFLAPYVQAQKVIEEAGEVLKKRIIEGIRTIG
jgi:hypothetical protein